MTFTNFNDEYALSYFRERQRRERGKFFDSPHKTVQNCRFILRIVENYILKNVKAEKSPNALAHEKVIFGETWGKAIQITREHRRHERRKNLGFGDAISK